MAVNPLASNVRHMLAVRGMKQTDLIAQGGFGNATVCYMLKEDRPYHPHAETIERLCEVLNCKASDLIGDTVPEEHIIRNRREDYEHAMEKHLRQEEPEEVMTFSEMVNRWNQRAAVEAVAETTTEEEKPVAVQKDIVAELLDVFAELLANGEHKDTLFEEYGRIALARLLKQKAA